MKIIVDTNIVFSALLNNTGTIGKILIDFNPKFEFYSCNYMRYEIDKHWEKLKKISKLSDEKLNEAKFHLFERIQFVNEELIPREIFDETVNLTQDIDLDDTEFVAMTIFLKGFLWTGDRQLYEGLISKGFENVLNTTELSKLV